MLIYLLRQDQTDNYKIGITRDLESRLKNLQTGCPNKIEVISTFKSKYARNLEGFFHRIWKHHKINGEWFYLIENERPDFMSLCEKLHNNLKILNEFQNK